MNGTVTLSLWLPVSRPNFFNNAEDAWLDKPPAPTGCAHTGVTPSRAIGSWHDANDPLVAAGVTSVRLFVDENGWYVFTAEGGADHGRVWAALMHHIQEVFGGDLNVHDLPTRTAGGRRDDPGSRSLKAYNGLRDNPGHRPGRGEDEEEEKDVPVATRGSRSSTRSRCTRRPGGCGATSCRRGPSGSRPSRLTDAPAHRVAATHPGRRAQRDRQGRHPG